MRKVRLGEYIEQCTEINSAGQYGLDAVRGVANTKGFIPTKANMDGRSFAKFSLIRPKSFAFNRRTTRNGERLGLGFNDTAQTYICTEDYVVFKVKEEYLKNLLPDFLYLNFLRDEFDRYVRWDSWGSATEFFNWENMCQVQIVLPSLDDQKAYVSAWQGLKELADNNAQMADPLFALCQSYLKDLKQKYPMQEIGPYLTPCDERNTDLKITLSQGISNNKYFQDPKQVSANSKSDKIVRRGQFAYNRATTRNGEKISIAYREGEDCTVSSAYQIFYINQEDKLDPHFLLLWFMRSEFDRYARYMSKGSAHEFFEFDEMCRVKIPLPPIEVQKAVVAIYRCAQENKAIAEEAAALSKSICPALMRQAMKGD